MRAAKQANEQQSAVAAAEDGGGEGGGEDFGNHMLKQIHAKRRAMGLEPAEAPVPADQRGQGGAAEQRQQQGADEPELDYGESEEEEAGADGGSGDDDEGKPAAASVQSLPDCLHALNCRHGDGCVC